MKQNFVIGETTRRLRMLRNALRPVFSLCAAFKGTLIIKRRANSLFLQKPDGKLGARAQKRGFACASVYFMFARSSAGCCLRNAVRGRKPHCPPFGRSNRSFPRRGIFRSTPLSKCRGFTFPACSSPLWGEKAKSVIFAFSRIIWNNKGLAFPLGGRWRRSRRKRGVRFLFCHPARAEERFFRPPPFRRRHFKKLC